MARFSWLSLVTFLTAVVVSRALLCQEAARPYDSIQAGVDAYQLGEERRQTNVGQQLYLNDLSRARLTPLATYGYGYRPFQSTFGMPPASVEYAYGYGNSPGGYASRYAGGRALTLFEPWPYVPGDIWGDLYIPRLRQPVAQVQTQTGPNRWESHPVYNPPLVSYPVLPPVSSPALRKTPYDAERPSAPIPEPGRETPGHPAEVRPSAPTPPSPGPSIDDEPARPRRRVF